MCNGVILQLFNNVSRDIYFIRNQENANRVVSVNYNLFLYKHIKSNKTIYERIGFESDIK